jgi:uncharacterized protein
VKLYLDSSAIVKLVRREAESARLVHYLRHNRDALRVTCALSRVEVVRAVLPAGPKTVTYARRALGRLHEVALDRELLDRAATLAPGLRSLDAVHLAAAQTIGHDLLAVVTYDERMAAAASFLGMNVAAPAA